MENPTRGAEKRKGGLEHPKLLEGQEQGHIIAWREQETHIRLCITL